MKSTNVSYTGDQSCSCTSCTYKSEADHPDLRRIISQGSRIDRLYYGKYIPLRERKLLEKLVRTRGVYDDIRAQLISNSTISLEKKAVLKLNRNVSPKKLKEPQYSNEIFKLVDLIDKGEKLESKELNGCCSCCTCSSKYDDRYKHIDKHRLKRTYTGALRHRYIKHKTDDYRKRGVRFKTKHIKSDPCTCTFKFSGMFKHLSKGAPKNFLGYPREPFADLKLTFDEEINQRPHKNSYLSFPSKENLQQSKTHLKEIMLDGIRKLSETKLRIQEKIDLHEKKSLEKLSKLKSNIKTKVKSFKVTKKNSAIMCKCPENNLLFHIKKDSISKFKDDLRRKKNLKDWECRPECVEDICIPKECYVKLKHKRSRSKNNEGKLIIRDQMIRESLTKPIIKVQPKQVGEVGTMPLKMNKQKPRLRAQQTRERANHWLHFTNEEEKILNKAHEDIKKGDHKIGARIPGFTFTNKTRATNLSVGPPRENASRQQVERIGSSVNFNIEFYKNKGEPNTNTSRLNLERLPDITKQSPIKYDHRERKNRKKTKTVHRRHQGSQIKFKYTKTCGDKESCSSFCPLKFTSKRKKPKNNTSLNERTHIKESSLTFNTITNNQKIIKLQKKGQKRFKKKQILLPYECEPNVCIPGICDPYQCNKLINTRNTKRKEQSVQCDCLVNISQTERTKPIPRLSSTPYPSLKTKFANSLTSYKRKNIKNKNKNKKEYINRTNYSKNGPEVVRIGSNISFNLEFYKTKYAHPISSPNIKILSNGSNVKLNKKTRSQQVLGDKATTHINKKLYKKSGFGTTLKRCFCTLKIQEKNKTKKKKMVTIGTNIVNDINSNAIVTYNKSTKTKKNPPLNYFECEPFVCIPGACDPYECLDRINRNRLKEVGSVTEPPEKVSVSSTTYLNKSVRDIQVQSKPQSKDRKTLVKTKNNASEIKEYSPSGNSNQAVRIGSSFSFDIQFFKTNTSVNKINSKPYIEQKTKMRSRIQKIGRTRKNYKLNVANITTQSKQKDKFTKSSMADNLIKRCFCTQNLQKYRKNQKGKQDILTTSMFPYVLDLMINRATTVFNPILTSQKTNSTSGIQSKVKDSSPNRLQSKQCQKSLIVVEKQSQCYSLNQKGDDNWESRISFIEERLMSLKQSESTNLSQYIRQCFCTMNLQLTNKNMSGKKPKSTIPTGSAKRIKEFSKGNKSSVRVGSNFSFNIAFSKNLSSSKYSSHTGLDKPIRVKPKEVETIFTKGNYNTTFEQQSQSAASKLIHKGSADMPLSKRCFCTLKLHKKGRKHMKNNQKYANITDVPNISIPKTPNNTISRGQNTDFKPMKIAQSLKPYECEPNICIPGHCDPYQCLEIMKRRNLLKQTKESGIVTVQNKKTASSITNDSRSKETQKGYQLKMKPKANSVKLYRNTFESDVLKPSRQLVRVGSNFSFNIDFFKDQGSPVVTHNTTKNFKDNKHINQRKYLSQNRRETGISTPKGSKLRRHKDTEIKKNPNRITSTMTSSFLKRCFCTAKLKKDSSPTFFKKCFCFIKSIKHSNAKNEGIHINKVHHVDKKINTKNVKLMKHQLAPYECEPGICIPGECNPYECEKILKRNRMRTMSKLSGTREMSDSRSVSIDSQLRTKNAKIQLKNRENYKVNNTRERRLSQSSSKHSDRQVVRIGSNFSFNIEFYKNNPSKHLIKLPPTRQEKKEVIRKKLKNQKSEVIATRTHKSQAVPISKIDRSTGQKHFLKRCFCTLQLHNQYSHEEKNQKKKIKQDTKLRDKSVMTKTPKRYEFILEDFECPPGICVPNQCNPYECERIIKMRRKQQEYKEFGMSTRSPKKSTVSSVTHSLKKYKQSTQTIGHRKYHKNTNYNAKPKEVSSSQRVKIGSSFEFNIEFFKNKNNHGLQINKQPKPAHINLKHQTKRKVSNAKTPIQKQVQFAKISDKKTKSQSKMINVSPKLKRCFCTLFMKSAKDKKPVKKHKTSNISTGTQKSFVPHMSTLLPYECEPQVCIPGECDPVVCLERIMKRNKHFGANTNFSQTKSSASTMAPGKRKFKAKKSQFKSVREHRTQNKTNLKKQAVRIGSNFNFNIEFYKDNAPFDRATKKHNQIEVLKGIKKSDFKENHLKKSFHKAKPQLQTKTCDVSTCPNLKNIPKEKQTNVNNNKSPTFLKKCFCVLKLHKLRNRRKDAATTFDNESIKQRELSFVPKHNIAIQQRLLPYECEPNVCIPGQCDPYECEKRIKARELCIRNKCDKKCYMIQKSQNICTQINNPCMDKCIGVRAGEYRKKKNQSSLARSATTKSTVNKPRLATNLNKQAVKIGSNFNFNIEFYKDSPPTKAPITPKHIQGRSTFENGRNKNVITKSPIRRNRGSQAKVITSEDKILDVQNELNRCFCTLKLQKNKQSNYLKKTHKYPQYPQTFEVRRVSVKPNSKRAKKKNQTPVRSVSTRINEKYMKANQNVCPCIAVTNTKEMKTILPFIPNKFKDTTSKTFIPVQNEIKSSKKTKRGLKLKKKKSKRKINYNEQLLKDDKPKVGSISNIKGFLCRCAGVFLKKQKIDSINTANHRRNNKETEKHIYNNEPKRLCENICFDNLRSSKSDRRPIEQIVNQNTKVRKSKSLKLENKKRNHEKKNIKESNKVQVSSKYAKVPNTDNNGITVSIKQNKKKDRILCSHCNVEIQKNISSWPPAKVHFDEGISLDETKGLRKVVKPVKRQQNKNVNFKEYEDCACCNSCGRRFNKEELLRAAGDRLIEEPLKNQNKIINPQKIKDLFKHINIKNTDNNLKNCRQQKEERPLFEMQLNSDLYEIINKDEVIDNITKLSKMRAKDKPELTKSHKKSCRCCICLGKRKKMVPKELMAKKKNKAKPCTCGSFVCSKKSQKMNKELVKVPVRDKRWKPCVCGSPICDSESATMKSLLSRPEEMTCICQEKIKEKKLKIQKKEEKRVAEQRAVISKKRNEEDRIRRKLRMRRDKEMEKKINTKSSDIILAAESVIDIGKLGITACTDILRSVARCTSDPKQAYYTLKSMKEDPEVIMSTLKSAYQDSGIAATAKRVRLRCLSMRGVKRIKNKLEQNAVTNFMLHIADNDPRRRVLKKKPAPVRLRERLDYGCSLYMGSLRKRPYLSIYDRWPWFYPHFLSLLNVWKQFTDIMLFLLAVVVWSPCIFCMEACRAIMCCFFCTG